MRFTFFRKGGRWHGAHVSRSRLLDWNFLGYVLRRGYATDRTTILGQTGFFVLLSYLKLTERMYIYVFGAYLTVFFIGFTYYTTFLLVPGAGH